MIKHVTRILESVLLTFCLAGTVVGQQAATVGEFDFSTLPGKAPRLWTKASGKAQESLVNQRWVVQNPQGLMRAIDLGPTRRSTGHKHEVEVVWSTNCRNNLAADGFCIHTHGRRLRIQPIHRSKAPDLLLTGTANGLAPGIKECRIDTSKLPGFDATKLNRYTIRWQTDATSNVLFELLVNGTPTAKLAGTRIPVKRASLSFEFRSGRQVVDHLRWRFSYTGKWLPPRDLQMARKLLSAGHRQLFLDDTLIDRKRTRGLQRVVHQPRKHAANPVIKHHQKPWQTFRAQLYGTVLYIPEEKRFKMWYLAGARFPNEKPIRLNGRLCCPNFQLLAYAESKDGLNWKLPNLGLVEFDGSKQNNICRFSRENAEGVAIVYDIKDPDPQRRYKAFYWEHHTCGQKKYGPTTPVNGMSVSFSADGKLWKDYAKNPVMQFSSDTGQQAVWDDSLRKYVVYGRFNAGGRKIARAESKDFVHWTRPQLVFQTDPTDGRGTQFYGMGITRYEGIYIGLPWIFRAGTTNRIDVQLAMSQDGIAWKRVGNRRTFIPNGKKGSFDGGCIFTAAQPIQVVGDRIFIFYSGLQLDHEEPRPSRKKHPEYGESSIGVATLRRDGFISLDATDKPGHVTTKPFVWPAGKRLYVNADAAQGSVVVSALKANGLLLATSKPLPGDQLQGQIVWSPKQPRRNQLVRLKFKLRNASLYSFWFGK